MLEPTQHAKRQQANLNQPDQTTLSPECGALAADICWEGGVPSWAAIVTPFQLKGQGLIFAMAWQLLGAEMSIPYSSVWIQARNGQDTMDASMEFSFLFLAGMNELSAVGSAVSVVLSDKVGWLLQ